ncbi:MAG: hypothetical protein ACQERJ_03980 [Bacillota bacterium]
MNLTTYLKKTSASQIKKLTTKHNIFYQPGFSRNWVAQKIEKKLLDHDYLQELLTTQLTPADKQLLQKLLTTSSITKASIAEENYCNLFNHGLIYERNNFCYLFQELKPLLNTILNTQKSYQQNKINNLSFFHYLILTLAQIKKLNTKQNIDIKNELLLFLQQINCTKFKNQQLLNYILNYCFNNRLLSSELKIKKCFYTWLTKAHQQKIITAINTLIPQSAAPLRKILAVLSHYPQQESIPLNFAYQELNLAKIDFETKELLDLLNIFKIKNKKIFLMNESWQYFNPHIKFKYKVPQKNEDQIIVPLPVKLKKLWQIADNNQLTAIQKTLVFKPTPSKSL